MTLLLTILSVLALWALLTTLVLGLLFILKPLEAIRGHLRWIATGVRAIEHETAPLEERVAGVGPSLRRLHDALAPLPPRLEEMDRELVAAVPVLRGLAERR